MNTTTTLKPTDLIPEIHSGKTFFLTPNGSTIGVLFASGMVTAHGCGHTINVSDVKPAQRYKAARTFIVENFRI